MRLTTFYHAETLAGGCWCSNRAFLRQARKFIRKGARGPDHREARHKWLRDGLAKLEQSRDLAAGVMTGSISV